jgi:hypothetical protein
MRAKRAGQAKDANDARGLSEPGRVGPIPGWHAPAWRRRLGGMPSCGAAASRHFMVHPAEAYLTVRWGTLSPKPPGIYRIGAKPGAIA